MKAKKQRLDLLLVERGLSETREKAKRAIMAGIVYSNEMRLDKPGEKVNEDIELAIKGKTMPYVSRGGLKLEKALQTFHIDMNNRIMIDIGASTGGFTDCALQNGATMSYAIDVGYNQLAWKLRQDERVIVMERTNFRYVEPSDLKKEVPNIATIDVSFISLTLILPVLRKLLANGSDVIALIKPQFEAGKGQVGKKGIVREKNIHEEVISKIKEFSLAQGYDILHLSYSPITGGEGNIEFLIHLGWESKLEQPGDDKSGVSITDIVEEAHENFKK
ncbi:TlyA family RNA methyltransferase [Lederbergia lenta]|uniref:TlyA family RNA methyltransferase n=1 Tax=Lederbergia lenta TaxID=1467 RepID=UPI00203F4FD7|nr:TlyA family RNA methyltransferase [Lederbergia lenta]MCM3111483.1 TlyA family RNA methyltransferase [Lederbergia lenta]